MFCITYYVHVISVLSKSPFYHIYLTVCHNISHRQNFSPNQLTTLGFHMQVPTLMIMAYVIGIHGKKRHLNLVLISHKYSQRNSNLEITFCHRCKNFVSLQSEGSQYHTKHQKRYVSLWVYSRHTFYHITSWLHKGTQRFHIQVLVLVKIAYFQEKVTTTSVPI